MIRVAMPRIVYLIVVIPALFQGRLSLPDNLERLSSANISRIELLDQFGDGEFRGDVRWSPDGQWLAVAGTLGVRVLKAETLEQVQFLPQAGAQDVAWSPDGHYLAGASPTLTQIWDTGIWKAVQSYEAAEAVVYSPDNHYLVLTQAVPYGNTNLSTRALFLVFDLKTHQRVGTISGDVYSGGEAFFTSDGRYLITQSYCDLTVACGSGVFQIWDMHAALPADINPEGLGVGDVYNATVTSFGDSQIAYLHTADGSQELKVVTLLTPSTGQQTTFAAPSDAFDVISLGSNLGVVRYAVAQPVTIDVMNPKTGITLQSFPVSFPIRLSISPVYKQIIATNDGHQVSLISLQSSELKSIRSMSILSGRALLDPSTQAKLMFPDYQCIHLDGAEPEAHCGIYSADNKFFVGTDNQNDSYIWDTSTKVGKQLVDVEPDDFARSFTFNDDSAKLAFSVDDCLMGGRCTNSTLYVWDINAQHLQSTTETSVIDRIVFMPDKIDSLLAVLTNTSVSFYDSRSEQTVASLPDFGASPIAQLTLSDDGKLVLTRSYDETIRVWGVKST